MADLIAQGPQRQDRWRRQLPDELPVSLGRAAGGWSVPWDPRISRQHASLCWRSHRLQVSADPQATNPIFFRGQPSLAFELAPGEHFVIGSTTFTLADLPVRVSLEIPHPVTEQVFPAEVLRHLAFRDAQQQIEALSRLPELITGADTDQELCVRLVNLLLTGISQATEVAVAQGPTTASASAEIQILHWDRATVSDDRFEPSGPLIREALRRDESVVHVWQGASRVDSSDRRTPFPWAFCTPVPGNGCRGWVIYVAGMAPPEATKAPEPEDLQDVLKFVELAASTVGTVCDVRLLQRRTAALGQFFSPPLRAVVATNDPEKVLAPRETEVAVLFCDLRGFSRDSEQSADNLFGLLQRVSESLGTMTGRILDHGGVIGDFHGDSAMGFWGWPLPQPDLASRAGRAALAIQAAFEQAAAHNEHALAGFRVGMGLATGRAVAGKIGTVDQVKVTAFGPVVNLAARLESMTRTFRTPILIDQATADRVSREIPSSEAHPRLLAWVRPYGMQSDLPVYELRGGVSDPQDGSPDDCYQQALQAFRRGRWPEARRLLQPQRVHDPAAEFLLEFMSERADVVPTDWNGVIRWTSK